MSKHASYHTYNEWRELGRQVKRGEHGERNHLQEVVFSWSQTQPAEAPRRSLVFDRSSKRYIPAPIFDDDIDDDPWLDEF